MYFQTTKMHNIHILAYKMHTIAYCTPRHKLRAKHDVLEHNILTFSIAGSTIGAEPVLGGERDEQ